MKIDFLNLKDYVSNILIAEIRRRPRKRYKDVASKYGVDTLSPRQQDLELKKPSKKTKDNYPHYAHVNQAFMLIYQELENLQSTSKRVQQDRQIDFALKILQSALPKERIEEDLLQEYYNVKWQKLARLAKYVENKISDYIADLFPQQYQKIMKLIDFIEQVSEARIQSLALGFDLEGQEKYLDIPAGIDFKGKA